MQTVKIICWLEDDAWLGYLEEYPDYWTQGETREDLEEHLRDLYQDLSGGQGPGATKARVADLIAREKESGLTPDETSELDHYMQLEHIMRLAKARARKHLGGGVLSREAGEDRGGGTA